MVRDPGGGPGGNAGDGAVLNADPVVLDGARARFETLASAFDQAVTPLGGAHDRALAAAGQFRGRLEPGAVKYLLSWREVFEVAKIDCQLIAGNINRQQVDLHAMDTHLAAGIVL